FETIGNRTIKETAFALSKTAMQQFQNPSLIVCSTGMDSNGEFFDAEALVLGLENGIGSNRIFYGGLAGDDMTFSGTYVFNNGNETDFGIVAIVLDADKINLTGMAITGWQKMGILRKVTKSAGNLV